MQRKVTGSFLGTASTARWMGLFSAGVALDRWCAMASSVCGPSSKVDSECLPQPTSRTAPISGGRSKRSLATRHRRSREVCEVAEYGVSDSLARVYFEGGLSEPTKKGGTRGRSGGCASLSQSPAVQLTHRRCSAAVTSNIVLVSSVYLEELERSWS